MVILHIACLCADPFAGVNVAVPQHVRAQQDYAAAGLLNLTDCPVEQVAPLLTYQKPFRLSGLPAPYDRPDLVVFHEVYRPSFPSIARMLRRSGVPYIIIPHGCLTATAQKQKRMKKLIGNFLLFHRFIMGAEAIQCLSRRELEQTGFGKQRFVGSNGVWLTEQRGAFSDVGMRFVYVGRLDIRIKGLDWMLQGVAASAELLRKQQCTLTLYGPDDRGAHGALGQMIGRLGIGDLVQVRGAVTGEEKKAALRQADCFIQTSRTEGMSMGILEALGSGLPCLVTEGTGMTGWVREWDAGWTCEGGGEAVALALARAVEERERLWEKSRHASALVKSLFSWETVAAQTVEQYRRLLSGEGKECI